MYHYNFTNDLRITSLDEILKDASIAYLTDTVPSATVDKSKNNNYNTVGFYFNLKAKGNCAKLASKGNVKKVVLNFIKKFQYPNPRTQDDLDNAKSDRILLAPMRDIVKLLHIFSMINNNEAYLTKNEIINFIFYNDELAKRKNYNLLNTANQIIDYRQNNKLPPNISTNETEHMWKQPDRQVREMIKTLNYSGCVSENDDKIVLNSSNISRDNEADLFEILNCNTYWTGDSVEDYQKYMDDVEIIGEDMTENKEYKVNIKIDKPYNRIIFGAPGTGKSHKLDEDSTLFTNQELIPIDDNGNIEQQIKDEISFAIKQRGKLCLLVAIGIKYSNDLKDESKDDLKKKYGIENIDCLYLGSRAMEHVSSENSKNSNESKNDENVDIDAQIKDKIDASVQGKKDILQNLIAIGIKYTDYLCDYSMQDLKDTYNLKSAAQVRWLYEGIHAMQIVNREKENAKKPIKFVERVTFHPNYSYAQFVGTYKPISEKTEDGKNEISYKYVPGPFIRTYIKAMKEKIGAQESSTPPKNFLLLIEEINRANVAAVFGDVFQLLDRGATGESDYPVTVSEDLKNYLHDEGIDTDTIAIPSNMYIWATMNSADQGVMPMDAAFKRRWDFEYLDIDDDEAVKEAKKYKIPIKKDGSKSVNWNEFRTELNKRLADIGVNEDKLLGPFFLSKNSLEIAEKDPDRFVSLFKSKVIMYLFEDVVKMNPTKLFVCEGAKKRRYSKICEDFDTMGLEIFGIKDADLENKSPISPKTETPETATEE